MPDVGAQQRASQKFLIFAKWEKTNTRLARESLPETDAAWLENIQPVGDNNLVPVPAQLAPQATLPGGETTLVLFPANINNIDYLIDFTTAGAGFAINIATNAVTQFAPDGTFSTAPDCTVYAGQRLLIADATAGYCTWDGTAFVKSGGVSPNIRVTNGGTGYTSAPTVTITGATGATAHAVVAGGSVVSVVLDTPGTVTGAITVGFSGGGGSGAAAAASAWPTISCTTLAVYAGRVWFGNSHVLQWTGTAGFDDTNPSNAAGSTTFTDADLSHAIQALRNLNNYLFIFGDTSVRQIGAISISGVLTLFTPLVLASDIGSTFKYTILSYNRLVLFANRNGVYAIFGASVEKISDDLDGIFGGAHGMLHSNIDFTMTPTAALNDIRNIHCYMLLVRYLDPSGPPRSLILVFQERKWFLCSQGNGLVAICAAPLLATTQFETFASSGSDITQLLQDSDTAVPVIMKTSLSPHNNPVQQKQVLHAAAGIRAVQSQPFTLQVDTENGAYILHLSSGAAVIWVNNIGSIVRWTNNSGQIVNWGAAGYGMPYGYADGSGKFLGITLTGILSNSVINLLAIEYQERALWGSAQ